MRSPHYGELNVVNLPGEVKTIWYSRDRELPELPRMGWSWQLQTDPELIERQDLARKIWDATPLTDREKQAIELYILQGETLKDVGLVMNVTRERVRQIVFKGLRKLRRHQKQFTGLTVYGLDATVETWFWWKRRNNGH